MRWVSAQAPIYDLSLPDNWTQLGRLLRPGSPLDTSLNSSNGTTGLQHAGKRNKATAPKPSTEEHRFCLSQTNDQHLVNKPNNFWTSAQFPADESATQKAIILQIEPRLSFHTLLLKSELWNCRVCTSGCGRGWVCTNTEGQGPSACPRKKIFCVLVSDEFRR